MAVLARNWWALAIRGIAAIIFGILAFIWPGSALVVLVLLFGAYALVDGIFAIVAAVTGHAQPANFWALILEGVVGIIIGLVTFFWPGLTAIALLYVIAAWALITGVLEVIMAVRLRREISNEWLLGLSGLASIIFGLLLVIFPGTGALAVIWLIAAYAIIFGIILLGLALRVRGIQHTTGPTAPGPA